MFGFHKDDPPEEEDEYPTSHYDQFLGWIQEVGKAFPNICLSRPSEHIHLFAAYMAGYRKCEKDHDIREDS